MIMNIRNKGCYNLAICPNWKSE